jgi:putative membrane protein
MAFIIDIIKGIFMGIANVIPGVSGGTMAVSLGIYDKFISSITGFVKDWKKSFKTLLPIVIGIGIGIVGFTYIIEYLLSEQTFVTCMTFVGLIFGGLPILFGSLKGKMKETHSKIGIGNVVAFVILFAVVVGLPMLGVGSETSAILQGTPLNMIILFFVGVIAAATMVIPGVSGSLVLMILGYYYGIINTIKNFLEALRALDFDALLNGILVLAPFGIGVLVGIVAIAKIIEYLFNKHSVMTYSAIFGLVMASPIAIFYNTGIYKQLSQVTMLQIIVGIILCAIGGGLTYILGKTHAE